MLQHILVFGNIACMLEIHIQDVLVCFVHMNLIFKIVFFESSASFLILYLQDRSRVQGAALSGLGVLSLLPLGQLLGGSNRSGKHSL